MAYYGQIIMAAQTAATTAIAATVAVEEAMDARSGATEAEIRNVASFADVAAMLANHAGCAAREAALQLSTSLVVNGPMFVALLEAAATLAVRAGNEAYLAYKWATHEPDYDLQP